MPPCPRRREDRRRSCRRSRCHELACATCQRDDLAACSYSRPRSTKDLARARPTLPSIDAAQLLPLSGHQHAHVVEHLLQLRSSRLRSAQAYIAPCRALLGSPPLRPAPPRVPGPAPRHHTQHHHPSSLARPAPRRRAPPCLHHRVQRRLVELRPRHCEVSSLHRACPGTRTRRAGQQRREGHRSLS